MSKIDEQTFRNSLAKWQLDLVDSKDARIKELEARLETAEKWNDVSKGELPEQNEWVLCVRKNKHGGSVIVTGRLLNNNVWSCSLDWHAAVTHWKPLHKLPFLTNKTE